MGFVEINLTSLIQLINFCVLLVLLYKLLYKPLMNVVDKRREKVQFELAQAERERQEALALKKEAENILVEARKQAEQIVENARQKAEQMINQAKSQAKEEAERIIGAAKVQIEKEKQQVLEEIERRATEIAVVLAMKILQNVLDEKAKREYLINILQRENLK
ncbi:F0F1 ATP synthase subunit B [Pseudothermotoga thermarum]|uniref:ATP synthase subunit b n=1 Tax=Pseudothermotoga thermarum DSM 5069 TaxID=688269 RepID=F7YV81_9THEM|nr:F0F1 ATP synthase subunit B [Pseudothermotoga thermarum]AEH50380.1 ATP synthase F0, B subunit [Pseudothermotoga thermarum DSM 5069]